MKTTKLYKLTNRDGITRAGYENQTKWGVGVTHKPDNANDQKPRLCSSTVIHAYSDPLLAALMNPRHANIPHPILWECKGIVTVNGGDKCGCSELTTVKQIPMPRVSKNDRVAFAIYCVRQVYKNKAWNKWAQNWLNGKDRSKKAAAAAADAADAAYAAAADAAYADSADAAAADAADAADAAAADAADAAYAAIAAAADAADADYAAIADAADAAAADAADAAIAAAAARKKLVKQALNNLRRFMVKERSK